MITAGWLAPAGLLLLGTLPIVAGSFRLSQLSGLSDAMPANPRFSAVPLPVVLHIVSATVFAILGPLQFAAGFRRRWPAWHRVAGRLLVACGLVVGLSGLWMTLFYTLADGTGPLLYASRIVFGSAMVASIVIGLAAILRRDVQGHRRWMSRGYAIGLGAATQMLTLMVASIVAGPPNELTHDSLMALSWVLNLAVAEWAIRNRVSNALRPPSLTTNRETLRKKIAMTDRSVETPHVAEHTHRPGEASPGMPPDMAGPTGVVPLVRRFGPSILINGVAPYFIYFVLHHQFQVAGLPALLATSIPPLLDALVGIVRWRRVDFLAGFVLFTIGLAVGLVAFGGDPRLYLIRESFITFGIGLAFILSNPLPRPLGFFFARYFMAGNDQARLAWVNDRWQRSASFRHAMRISNVVWGLGFVLEAAVRTYLVLTLSIEQFLIASPIVFYGFYAVLLGWSIAFGRRKRQQAMRDQAADGSGGFRYQAGAAS